MYFIYVLSFRFIFANSSPEPEKWRIAQDKSESFNWKQLKIVTASQDQQTEQNTKKTFKVVIVNEGGGKDQNNQERSKIVSYSESTVCRIPKLDINGSEVVNFFGIVPPLNCAKKGQNWAYVDSDGIFHIDRSVKEKHGDITCNISYFYRVDDYNVKRDPMVSIEDGTPLSSSDFSELKCIDKDNKKWTHYFWTVMPNKTRIEELKRIKRDDDWSGLSVYFIGYDSLSQLSFRRNLPKTIEYLEKNMEAVVLNGYNIVGDGTPQAFIPILTGKTEIELPLTRKRYKAASYVDEVYPFVWKNFSDSGYITLYMEDTYKIGTFTYRLKLQVFHNYLTLKHAETLTNYSHGSYFKGFKDQPTDHYGRTFFQLVEPHYKTSMSLKCLGSLPMHKEFFRYAGEALTKYDSSIPKFSLAFHGSLSHDHINLIQVADEDTANNLKDLHESGAFDNCMVIVMSDHGHRFAKLRETHQGQLEERLPFFAISLPKKFRETEHGKIAYRNLLENKDRLSSPFDIHATLLDILHWPNNEILKTVQSESVRSLSLFRPIPENRTCASAGIEPHWCTCLNWETAMKSEEDKNVSEMLSAKIVETFNTYTEPERKLCSPLKLEKVEDSHKLVPHTTLLKYKKNADQDGFVADFSGKTVAAFALYQLRFRTTPGNALYEATVKYDSVANQLTIDMTAISHVNQYGDQPHCIIDKNYFLAPYCVCYDKIEKESR